MGKSSWTGRVRNEVLHRVEEERNILHTVKRRKANWNGHIFCRNCLLKHIIEGKTEGGIEVTKRQSRRHKQLLNDLKETRGYWKLKEQALDRTLWFLNSKASPSKIVGGGIVSLQYLDLAASDL
jgi:hypothetical protein